MKVKKDCPGYRNQLDLSFRNESDQVIEKVRAKAKAKAKKDARTPRILSPAIHQQTPESLEPQTQITVLLDTTLVSSSSPKKILVDKVDDWHEDCTLDFNSTSEYFAPILAPHASVFSIYPTAEEFGISWFTLNFIYPSSGTSRGHFSYVPDLCKQDGLGILFSYIKLLLLFKEQRMVSFHLEMMA